MKLTMPSPARIHKLASLHQAAQARAMVHIQHSQVGSNNDHIAKLNAVNPNLGHAARQLAAAKPWHPPNTEAQHDSVLRAHKAMANASAFHKAANGLAPVGKRAKNSGLGRAV